jgi:hypothetical protein
MSSDALCRWLHEKLESLPLVKFPFDITKLPDTGIYFFYEEGEKSTHTNNNHDDDNSGTNNNNNNNSSTSTTKSKPRIVRISTCRQDNFRRRISEDFLLNEAKMMTFTIANAKPSDRSIFRKNIGRALLNKENDYYQKIWEIDFTIRENCNKYGIMRNIQKEKQIESTITKILREKFSFRFIPFEGQAKKMVDDDTARIEEGKLIGTVASCNLCKASDNWLGKYSPTSQIRSGKLWLSEQEEHYLNSPALSEQDKQKLENAIINTK